MSTAVDLGTLEMQQAEEKFFRLLQADRSSDEFQRLFAEVDAVLDRYAPWEPAEA